VSVCCSVSSIRTTSPTPVHINATGPDTHSHLVAGRTRKLLQKHALPFPVPSVHLIPKESLDTVDAQLSDLKTAFQAEVVNFENQYVDARRQAREILGELFDDADYPVDILPRFGFTWRFLAVEVPGKSTLLSPEIYAREKQKFQDMMAETRELAQTALREEFAQVVESLSRRLTAHADAEDVRADERLFARPRPDVQDLLVAMPADFSFPSAHTAQAAAFALACAIMAGRDVSTAAGLLVWGSLSLTALLVGISRVYLQVHSISDVVAGAFLGAAWVLTLNRLLKWAAHCI